jgi:hypothetical protein
MYLISLSILVSILVLVTVVQTLPFMGTESGFTYSHYLRILLSWQTVDHLDRPRMTPFFNESL